jgi:aldehyde dehydrogenase (NAD+)
VPSGNNTKLLIGGEWRDAASGATFDDLDPHDGKVWATPAAGGKTDAEAAIDAAAAAQAGWAALSHPERAGFLLAVADELERRQEDHVEALAHETGSCFGKAMYETGYAPGIFRAAAAAAYQTTGEILPSETGKLSLVERTPVGVVSVISPWNFPLLLSSRGIAVALAVGNSVVLKPSEESPLTGGTLIGEAFEAAGLPPGVLNVVTSSREEVGAVGEVLVAHPAVGAISFTGSEAVGRSLAAKAGQQLKKICLELGGKDALLVLDDADLDRAVAAATFGAFLHQGQICMSVERVIADAAIADAFTERFVERVRGLAVGPPTEPGNSIGPLINPKQLERVHAHVTSAAAAGADVRCGGSHDGLYYQPTVLTGVDPRMAVWTEETFGPVAPVIAVSGDDEAVALANASRYGLTGMAHVNDCSVYDEPHVPFGGVKASGLGRHGGRLSVEAFTKIRWLTLERGGRAYPPGF